MSEHARRIEEEIAERKRAEDALKESQANLLQAQYIARIGNFTWDIASGEAAWSDGMYRLLKYDPNEEIDYEKVNAEIHHPDDLERVTKWLMDSIASGQEKLTPNEYRLVCKDGEVLHVHVEGRIEYRDGKAVTLFGTCQDISERKRHADERARLTSILEATSDLVAIAMPDKSVVYMNTAGKKLLGWNEDEDIRGKVISNAHPPWATDVVENEAIPSAIRDGIWEGETALRRADGSETAVSQVMISHKTADGELEYLSTIMRDVTERKLVEEASKASERKYRRLHDSMMDAFVSVDMDGRILEFNAAYQQMLGYPSQELGALAYKDLTPAQWHPVEDEIVRNQVLTRGYSDIYEKEYRRKDGSVFPVELRTYLIGDESGWPEGMWAIVRDITERKQAREALQASERNYRELFNATTELIFVHDALTGALKDINQAALDALGYTKEEIAGLTVQDLSLGVPPFAQEDAERIIGKAVEEGPQTFEWYAKRKNGELFWCENRLKCAMIGGEDCVLCVSRDITERKRAEEERRQNREQLRLLLENMEDMVSRHLPDSTITYVSPSCRSLIGYTPEELVDTRAADYVHPDDVRATLDAIGDAVQRRGGHYRVQHRMKCKNGEHLWVETAGRLLYEPDGRLREIQCVVRDTTERQRAEEELLAWKKRYESAVESSGHVLYDWNSATNQVTYGGAIEHVLGYSADEMAGDLSRWTELIHPDDRQLFNETIEHLIASKESIAFEYRVRRKDGAYILIEDAGQFIEEDRGEITQMIGFVKDITESKKAEQERLAHLRFLENMERINRAIVEAGDLDRMMDNVLDVALSIFNCDRAYFLYPCDPEAPTWSVPMERTRPEYPGAFQAGVEHPMTPELAAVFKELLTSNEPMMLEFNPGDPDWDPKDWYSVRSNMPMAVFPKIGKPWVLGLQQCSHLRKWTDHEQRLFKQICRRLTDALSALLYSRDLCKSEERHRLFVESFQGIAYQTEIESAKPHLFEGTIERITGYDAHDFVSEAIRWDDLVHPEDTDKVYAEIKRLRSEPDHVADTEYRILHKDGNARWVRDVSRLVRIDDRTLFQGTVVDITDRKQVENRLQASEANYRTIFDSVWEAIVVHDMKTGAILDVNKRMCEMFGYTHDEAMGLTVEDISLGETPYTRAEAAEWIQKAVTQGPQTFEWICKRKNGETLWIEVTLTRVVIAGQERVLAADRDITERKRAEEELRESESRLREAQQMAQLGHWVWDVKTGDVEWSEEVYRIFRLDPKEFKPQIDSIMALSPWSDTSARHEELIQGAIASHEQDSFEQRSLRPDGSTGYYFSTFQGVYGDGGELIAIRGTVQDITERKRTEEEREALIAKLEAQNAELEQFTYTVSHDLKSPLITIKGYVGMLRQDLTEGDPDLVEDNLSRISDAADKMDLLLRDLLALSRIGRLANPPENVPLGELAREAIELVSGQAEKSGVQVEIAPNLPLVFGDRLRLREVLQNLVDNGVKYMGDQARPRIEIGSRRDGPTVICYVRDNGIGIDPRYHEKIFGLFDQLDPKVDGSGIGLALVKRIVEVHGGRIWVESEGPGRGSTFCFTIAAGTGSREAH